MKKYLLLFILGVQQLYAQENTFKIEAKFESPSTINKAYIQYVINGQAITDSVKINNKSFSFQGSTDGYASARLFFDYTGKGFTDRKNKMDMKVIYLEPSIMKLSIKDSLYSSTLFAGKLNDDYTVYKNFTDSLNDNIMDIRRAAYSDAKIRRQITSLIQKAEEGNTLALERFVPNNSNSFFSLDAVLYLINRNASVEKIDSLYNLITDNNKSTRTGRTLKNTIEANRLTAIGIVAPLFSQNDVNNKKVNLSDYKGKYVLIDFWASWCGPCRVENPHLVRVYNKYKDQGFDILGVSLDNEKQRDAWIKAIKDDGLEWTQVSDLKGWRNDAAILYGVRSVPSSYLIDPNGIIVAKNLRGNKLDQKLKEIFDK